ncbi:MAG TPA: aminoacyl-tRNA hydrolase [Pyrinomonadaceae bacterium]|nr:aminoacyl-tRNA hydrolase [Pyrinomonadaceae bacterium]
MRLIVGLGNPGEEYTWTRHNLGFMLIDKLAAAADVTVKRRECRSLIGSAVIEGERVRLVKPQTFMNLSGEAVAGLLAKENVDDTSRDLIVISDDLALPFGTIRLRERGSAGGHNGLKSIIGAIGTNEFIRLRIGIQPDHPVSDSKAFVLENFRKPQRAEVEKILDKAAEAVHSVLRDGIRKAMSLFN